jgi:hypothetical protein
MRARNNSVQFMCRASGDITALKPTACGQIIARSEVAYTGCARKNPRRDRARVGELIKSVGDRHDEDDIYPTADRHDVARSGTAYALWSGNEKTRTG